MSYTIRGFLKKGVKVVTKPAHWSKRWNIFARELEDILATRGLRLGHLDDRKVVYHSEKVRRLQQSLESPRHLTTLNPEEMERLTEIMNLTELEQKRLRAALLATAVEMILMDRIDPETALMASDDVFNILFAAMRAQPGMVMASSVKGGAMTGDADISGDAAFTQALDLIDRATLALHVSRYAPHLQAQVVHARQAYDGYTRSIELLRQCQVPEHTSESWRFWYDEAFHGQEIAIVLMQPKEDESA